MIDRPDELTDQRPRQGLHEQNQEHQQAHSTREQHEPPAGTTNLTQGQEHAPKSSQHPHETTATAVQGSVTSYPAGRRPFLAPRRVDRSSNRAPFTTVPLGATLP